MWRRLSIALLASCGVLAVQAADKAGPAVGATPPDFKSRDAVTHEPIQLSAQTGKVVVLTFFASWCAPCRKEVPILENLQSKVGKDQLVVYAVPFEQSYDAYNGLVRLFRSWKITLIDDRSGAIARHYNIHSIPHLFLIGRDGRIAAEHLGYGEGSIKELVTDVNAALRAGIAPESPADSSPPAEH
jgi:thiol-disulfide isomerase/thioredoxin